MSERCQKYLCRVLAIGVLVAIGGGILAGTTSIKLVQINTNSQGVCIYCESYTQDQPDQKQCCQADNCKSYEYCEDAVSRLKLKYEGLRQFGIGIAKYGGGGLTGISLGGFILMVLIMFLKWIVSSVGQMFLCCGLAFCKLIDCLKRICRRPRGSDQSGGSSSSIITERLNDSGRSRDRDCSLCYNKQAGPFIQPCGSHSFHAACLQKYNYSQCPSCGD